ncbi:MAG: HAD hydrolase-like protein [Proteobacteria bacterium]|nr:HAD hydrolase-like protein [Pseudomonadota bacterium]
MKLKAGLIDLDGTLVHYETNHVVEEAKRISRVLNLPELKEVHILRCIAKGRMDEIIHNSIYPNFENYFWQMFDEAATPKMRLLPQAKIALQNLTNNNIKLALVTARNVEESEISNYLKQEGILHFFSAILTKRSLSSPWAGKDSYFLSALRALNLTPKEALAVGDRPSDAKSASAIGIALNVLVRTGGIDEDVLRTIPCHHIVDDISHLPNLTIGAAV